MAAVSPMRRLSFQTGGGARRRPHRAAARTAQRSAAHRARRRARRVGAVYLLDDRWRRKTVGLVAGSSIELAQPLLSPLYYVSRALEPYAEFYEPQTDPELAERLERGLSMLVLADVGVLPQRAPQT